MDTEQDNVYLYSHPQTDSGWFRVSLNTTTAVAVTLAEKLKRIFENRENVCRDEQTGNLVHSYERNSEENGVKIHLYYWIVANVPVCSSEYRRRSPLDNQYERCILP